MSVNPDPSSCSSDQVSPSEDYNCYGLVLGTHYTFTVSAINCGDQEGERNVFDISLCGLSIIIVRIAIITSMIVVGQFDNSLRNMCPQSSLTGV